MASLAFPISRLVDPVLLLLLAIFVGLWRARSRRGAVLNRRARVGLTVAWAGAIGLWVLATPVISSLFTRAVAAVPSDIGPELAGNDPDRRALVVLGAAIYPEEHGAPAMERLSDAAMERCIGAARIYQTYGFRWVIVSGRNVDAPAEALSSGMADLMVALGVPRDRILLESMSRDTKQNALFSVRMAREVGAERLVVVTSALHTPRAAQHFAAAGFPAVMAPVRRDPPPPWRVDGFIPSANALRRSQRAVHELLGRLEP
ncbi:YdcF family protein [Chondromyces apiculatus]|uniref:Membrane Protein Functionally coupled to the MukBEF Chromosome Partitioning Mechanism n=1 Tax=Chondromyces apiculatus DSM 436 TaxID=1192034 RepID=A0A017T1E5_9BACT|nr:YdcF family protein [Chondromyces apiculatus]EYF03049.1 Membrane Protein Functionally coupled to the MukBEF Chromosome Partitioning Mechanism [Chondromyces apiculatus DSM 436]